MALALKLLHYFFHLRLLQGYHLSFRQDQATLASSTFNRFRMVSRSCRSHDATPPVGEMVRTSVRYALGTRSWATAIDTMASFPSNETRFFSSGFWREISCSAASPPIS